MELMKKVAHVLKEVSLVSATQQAVLLVHGDVFRKNVYVMDGTTAVMEATKQIVHVSKYNQWNLCINLKILFVSFKAISFVSKLENVFQLKHQCDKKCSMQIKPFFHENARW